MTKRLAFGTLLLVSTQLVSPAALAQDAATPPAAPAQAQPEAEPQAEETGDVSAPGFDADAGKEIVVTGRNIPNVIRATPQVVSVLTAEDIARTGEGDIAGALTRVTGLSVVGNGFVFVRGLGDRYSSSMLNGSPLPSPEPLRRVVPLDKLMDETLGAALMICGYGQLATMAAKESVNRAFESGLSDGVMFERRLFHGLFATADQKEGMDAFVNKRPADFKHL